ncbi:Protein argonaute [Tilletia horrida]|uniref:Protein argonaute n=1 Tax=Tilletia horrida TaxID=155126 RepID=A0AAN6JM85_9BASI|nr:Protein argonaute [Tilletia horrida]
MSDPATNPLSTDPAQAPASGPVPAAAGSAAAGAPSTSEKDGLAGPNDRRPDQIPLDLAKRPDDGGNFGRPINLLANVFKLNFRSAAQVVTHYDVVITPIEDPEREAEFQRRREEAAQQGPVRARKTRPPPPGFLQSIFKECAESHARINDRFTNEIAAAMSFDGRRNAYSTKPLILPAGTTHTEFTTNLGLRMDLPEIQGHAASRPQNRPPRREPPPRQFKVSMTVVANINLSDLLAFCRGDTKAISDAHEAAASGATPSVLTAIQTLEVALRSNALGREEYHIQGASGRKFFSELNTVPIAGGIELWRGFFQSIRPMKCGPALNLDVAISSFLGSGDLIQVIGRILGGGGGGFGGGDRGGFRGGRGGPRGGGGRGRAAPPAGVRSGTGHAQGYTPDHLGPGELRLLRNKLKGVSIRLNHRPTQRVFKFIDFTPRSAHEMTFERDGQQISIVQYFQQNYNMQIRYPGLPCVVYRRQGPRTEFVPIELVTLVGGTPVNGFTLSSAQRQDMIANSSLRPADRKARVDDIRTELNYDADPKLNAWQMSIDRQMLGLRGRVLPAPGIVYGPGSQGAMPANGTWNLARARFVVPGRALTTWAIINFTRIPAHAIQSFTSNLVREMENLGMTVNNRQPFYADGGKDINQIKRVLHEAGRSAFKQAQGLAAQRGAKAPPPQLFVCFMEETDAGFYDQIKRMGAMELVTPVPTQVLNTRKALSDRGQQQYAANVAMKMNIKLGGMNWTVQDTELPGVPPGTMIVGADVTHPTRRGFQPSIAASVATMDGARMKYSAEIRAQRHPGGRAAAQEIILDLASMMEGHLKRWQKVNNGQMPKSILFFRDGISEGQFSIAVTTEYEAIKAACVKVGGEAAVPPKVTFVVASKNHNIRFFAQENKDYDRSGNLPAGTCVDSAVVHPTVFDFYLQAHAGLIGTARPTHYIVLKDENNFSSDNLQRSVHTLCYTYSRATRSVSLIPPAYYADVLADKSRALVWDPIDDAQSIVSGGSSSELQPLSSEESTKVMRRLEISPDFCESLWFM